MQGPAYRIQGVMKGNDEGIPFCCHLQWAKGLSWCQQVSLSRQVHKGTV